MMLRPMTALALLAATAALAGCGGSSSPSAGGAASASTKPKPAATAEATAEATASSDSNGTLSMTCPSVGAIGSALGGTFEAASGLAAGECEYSRVSAPQGDNFTIFFYSLEGRPLSVLQTGVARIAKSAGGSAVQSVSGLGQAAYAYTYPASNDPSETETALYFGAGGDYAVIKGNLTMSGDDAVARLLLGG
jgi:hypothetical protein